jgi:hypothetical protein
MAKDKKPTRITSRNLLTVAIVLVVFVLFLTSLSIALAMNYFDSSKQIGVIVLVVLLPLVGLIFGIRFIYNHSQRLFAVSKDEVIFSHLMPPESQRRRLNDEVRQLAIEMNVPYEQFGDLRAAYILAEDLALREIEQEKKLPLKRHIKVGDAEFDAVFISRDVLTFVEVTFLVAPQISQEKVNAIFAKIEAVKRNFRHIRKNSQFRLLAALVTQLDAAGEQQLRSTLADKFAETPVDVDIRFFDFEELQKTFTEE